MIFLKFKHFLKHLLMCSNIVIFKSNHKFFISSKFQVSSYAKTKQIPYLNSNLFSISNHVKLKFIQHK